jgi:hypothetical protein
MFNTNCMSIEETMDMFYFIDKTTHPSLLFPACNYYCRIIDKFIDGDFETFNNYILYTKNKPYFPPISFVITNILNNIKVNNNNKYKLFCTLFWLYLKKHKEINDLSNQLTAMVMHN